MNNLMTADVNDILQANFNRPAISIFLPFEPKMNQKYALHHSLAMATTKVRKELKEHYSPDVMTMMTEKLEFVIGELNYNTFRKSIAIYVSPVFQKVIYLDIPVEEKIIVGDSFEIRDLVFSKKRNYEYLLLLLSGNGSRIYLGKPGSLELILVSPVSVDMLKNDAPEKVSNFSSNSERKEENLKKFLRHLDVSLGQVLGVYRLPLFVSGSKRVVGHFKNITHHDKAVIEYIPGDYIHKTEKQVSEILSPFVDHWQKVLEKDIFNQLEEAASQKRLVTGIRNVWQAASAHRGRLLVLDKEFVDAGPAGMNKAIVYMHAKPYNKYSHIKDCIGDIIEKVLENGGDVEFVDKSTLKDYQPIALVQYY